MRSGSAHPRRVQALRKLPCRVQHPCSLVLGPYSEAQKGAAALQQALIAPAV